MEILLFHVKLVTGGLDVKMLLKRKVRKNIKQNLIYKLLLIVSAIYVELLNIEILNVRR